MISIPAAGADATRPPLATGLVRAMARHCAGSHDLEAGLRFAVDGLAHHLRWSVIAVHMVRGGRISPTAIRWVDPAVGVESFRLHEEACCRSGECLAARVADSGVLLWSQDLARDTSFPWPDACPLTTGVAFPVAVGRDVVAVLECYSTEPRDQDPRVVEILEAVGFQLALLAAREEAWKAMHRAVEAREELLGLVAHDLMQPVTAASMAAERLGDLMERELAEDPAWAPYLRILGQAVAQTRAIISQLVDVGRMEAGHFTVHPRPARLRPLVEQAVTQARAALGQGAPRVEVRVPGSIEALADGPRLIQLVGNLVSNALRASPPGGEVSVRARRSGDWVEVSVADQGPGVPPEVRESLWDRFARPAGPGGRRGLGLTIAREITEAHGGRIWLDEGHSGGARFHFTLHRADAQGGAGPAPPVP